MENIHALEFVFSIGVGIQNKKYCGVSLRLVSGTEVTFVSKRPTKVIWNIT